MCDTSLATGRHTITRTVPLQVRPHCCLTFNGDKQIIYVIGTITRRAGWSFGKRGVLVFSVAFVEVTIAVSTNWENTPTHSASTETRSLNLTASLALGVWDWRWRKGFILRIFWSPWADDSFGRKECLLWRCFLECHGGITATAWGGASFSCISINHVIVPLRFGELRNRLNGHHISSPYDIL
jgi:hypothetical protein